MNSRKKDEIIKLIRKHGKLSTTKIAAALSLNQNYARKYLEELEAEGRVSKDQETIATYWKLNDGTKQNKLQ